MSKFNLSLFSFTRSCDINLLYLIRDSCFCWGVFCLFVFLFFCFLFMYLEGQFDVNEVSDSGCWRGINNPPHCLFARVSRPPKKTKAPVDEWGGPLCLCHVLIRQPYPYEWYLLTIYLSVTVFTINSDSILFFKIIGSSAFHNCDGYTVVYKSSICYRNTCYQQLLLEIGKGCLIEGLPNT